MHHQQPQTPPHSQLAADRGPHAAPAPPGEPITFTSDVEALKTWVTGQGDDLDRLTRTVHQLRVDALVATVAAQQDNITAQHDTIRA